MRKFPIVALAITAVCAFSALTAASAVAVLEFEPSAKWLKNGATFTTTESTNTEGEILFANLLNDAEFLCSGLFEGTVNGSTGIAEVTGVFRLGSSTKTGELDESGAKEGILCTNIKLCEKAEIWPNGLPFKSELMLDKDGTLQLLLLLNSKNVLPGYFVLCEVIGIDATELCVTAENGVGEVSNAATDVEPLGAIAPEGSCNGNAEDTLIENNASNIALIALLTGSLAVSE